jgi:putative copper export protein
MGFVRWLHLVAGAVWLGGLITVGAVVPALRRAGATREQLQAMARRFANVAWAAMALAVATGLIQIWDVRAALRSGSFAGKLLLKVTFVAVAAGFSYWHQTSARDIPPRTRGIIQGIILITSLAIYAMAVAL